MIMLITHDCHTIVNEATTSLLKKLQKKKKKPFNHERTNTLLVSVLTHRQTQKAHTHHKSRGKKSQILNVN